MLHRLMREREGTVVRRCSFRKPAAMWAGVIALAAHALVLSAAAPRYPERPIRLLIPFPPGGGADTVARIVSPRLTEAMGQQWVVDNRGGAAGNIATEIVVAATADGHTVLLGFSTTLTVNSTLYKLRFNVAKDLEPVTMLAAAQYMLVLHPLVKANTLKEFIELAKTQPGRLNYASAGVGSPLHLSAELFKTRTGLNLVHVPYKGGGPAAAAVLAGEAQVLFGSLPSSFPHVRAGRLKALAVTGPKRTPVAPEVPTVAESGFPGFEVTSWYGLLVPARTPERAVRILYEEAQKVMQLPDMREQIARQGLEIALKDPKEFAERIRQETVAWAKVVKAAGIRAE